MVEVLVASVVLLLTMIPMGMFLTSAMSAAADARQRQGALQLADSWVEILTNSQPPPASDGSVLTNTLQTPQAPEGSQAPPSTLGGTTYNVTAEYTENLVNDIGQSDLCSAGEPPSPAHPGVIQLQIVVTWNNGNSSVSDTTEINYPKPGLQTEGFLAINVTNDGEADIVGNSAAERLEALPVTITQTSAPVTTSNPTGSLTLSPSSFTLHSDQNGCIFAQVPVGTYDVAILKQPVSGTPLTFTGYPGTPQFLNASGSPTEDRGNQVVTVTAAQTVQLDAFDEGIIGKVSYGGASAVDDGVECPGAAGLTCITTGSGPSGGSAAWGGAGSAWTSTTLSAATHINQVACTTASSAKCVGVGYGPSGGVILATSSDFNATSNDTVPSTVTDITQVTCSSNQGCYAAATTASGPVLLAGEVGPGADHWSIIAPPLVTFTALNSIDCPTSTTCELSYAGAASAPGVLRLDGNPAGLASNPAWMPVVTADTLPGTVKSVGTITCPSASDCLATAVGDQAIATDPTVITAAIAGSGASTWSAESRFPTRASSVSGISCTPTTCLAIGSATGTAAVWTGDLTASPHNWVQANGIPNSVAAVTSVACGLPASADAADCTVTAVTSGPASSGELLEGSLSRLGSWAWNPSGLPSGATVQYYLGVSCESPVTTGNSTCAAVGATAGGPIVLASSTGPAGTWSNQTPAPLSGTAVTGIPLETTVANTSSWTTQVTYGKSPNATTLPNVLYPQAGGYWIVAGDCAAEVSPTSKATLNAPPGGSATATVPLGLLPILLVSSTGRPVSGATVTLTSTSCSPGADAYNLPVTDAEGVTMTSVPYGSYSYTVTKGGMAVAHTTVTLTVGASSVQVTNGSTPTTDYLPGLVQVPA